MKLPLLTLLALSAGLVTGGYAQTARPQPTQSTTTRSAAATTAARVAANSNFRLTGELYQRFFNGVWVDSARHTFSRFNAANLPNREVREQYTTRGGALRPFRRQGYQYNAAGAIVTDSSVTYTNGTPNNYPSDLLTYTYNAQGKLLALRQDTRAVSGLIPYGRDSYSYNAQGQLTRILYEGYLGTSPNGSWVGNSQERFIYNAQNQVAEVYFEIVISTPATPLFRTIFTHDAAGRVTVAVRQNETNGAYVNSERFTYTYTSAGLQSTVTQERYVSNAWQPNQLATESYDADGNHTQTVLQLYRNGAYVNSQRITYTYQRNPLGTASANTLRAGLTVAPNPATAASPATLRYALPKAAPVAVPVLDALGRPVAALEAGAQTAGPHTLALPRLPLAAGLYLVRLTAGHQSQTVKLLVE